MLISIRRWGVKKLLKRAWHIIIFSLLFSDRVPPMTSCEDKICGILLNYLNWLSNWRAFLVSQVEHLTQNFRNKSVQLWVILGHLDCIFILTAPNRRLILKIEVFVSIMFSNPVQADSTQKIFQLSLINWPVCQYLFLYTRYKMKCKLMLVGNWICFHQLQFPHSFRSINK